jgi:hypothetical protein
MDALATVSPANRFETEMRTTGFATHEVATVTLDQALGPVLHEGERVGFINIDVEGYEFAVLKGAEKVILADGPVLLIELEYRHGAQVADCVRLADSAPLRSARARQRRTPQRHRSARVARVAGRARLARRLVGDRHAGYVNNVFFLPQS